MKPFKQYKWQEILVDGEKANILAGRFLRRGSNPLNVYVWNGWEDPLFTTALEVVLEESCKIKDFDHNLKSFFRLQMVYLLLWSSIERYVKLRYNLSDGITQSLKNLSAEPAFVAGVRNYALTKRAVFRADEPATKINNGPEIKKLINYYYQIRSNITHQGKGFLNDFSMLQASLLELLKFFKRC